MIRRTALVATTVLAVALGVVLPAAPGHAAATAVTCPADPAPIDRAGIDRVWSLALPRLASLSGPATMPFGATGRSPYVRTGTRAWTSGFYPTSLWLAYQQTKDNAWLARARDYTERVLPVASWRGTHDLGFMVGQPATLGMLLDPDTDRGYRYATAIGTAADSLSTRWNARVQALRSAYYGGKWGVIIDSAMNAPLLIEAALVFGGPDAARLRARGLGHLRTLARTFVRPDGSTFHRMAFNPRTGRLIGPLPGQGASTTSTWARGQAWAINGFARGYRLTKDEVLLDAARRTAEYWMSKVPAGCIPAWDLDVTNPDDPRDSSAAAIAADGLLALAVVDPDDARAERYRTYALTTLGTLARAPWTAAVSRGVLARQAYSIPMDRREGTYVWGDAFLLSALSQAAAPR